METAKILKKSKCFKFNETYNKCCLTCVDFNFEFEIFKMAAVAMETAKMSKKNLILHIELNFTHTLFGINDTAEQ